MDKKIKECLDNLILLAWETGKNNKPKESITDSWQYRDLKKAINDKEEENLITGGIIF